MDKICLHCKSDNITKRSCEHFFCYSTCDKNIEYYIYICWNWVHLSGAGSSPRPHFGAHEQNEESCRDPWLVHWALFILLLTKVSLILSNFSEHELATIPRPLKTPIGLVPGPSIPLVPFQLLRCELAKLLRV